MNRKLTTALICNSNMFAPYVLSEILSNRNKSYLIMSDIDSIVHFFKEINLKHVDVLLYRQPSLRNILMRRREILYSTRTYIFESIIFFHTEFGGIINWFLIRQSNKTKILFCKVFIIVVNNDLSSSEGVIAPL